MWNAQRYRVASRRLDDDLSLWLCIGAMCREAQSAQSTKDFINKLKIALKESRELEYWIELLIETNQIQRDKFSTILKDTD